METPIKKKALGQHFLRKQSVADNMVARIIIEPETSIMEIGCGDGFLTKTILSQTKCLHLVCYEIDPEWAEFTRNNIIDTRLKIKQENFLLSKLKLPDNRKPWVLLSNLPYQVTFPILFILQENKSLFSEGVIMIQEEVAQKLVSKKGRSYSATSLFLQYHFDFELMEKIEPSAFLPSPKVYSRLVYFKPKFNEIKIRDEEKFWKFLKLLFKQPRRTLKNNLKSTHYDISKISEELILKRAQEISFEQFLNLWNTVK